MTWSDGQAALCNCASEVTVCASSNEDLEAKEKWSDPTMTKSLTIFPDFDIAMCIDEKLGLPAADDGRMKESSRTKLDHGSD
eukprot:CAMPEP_0197625910 /NCGR_PEP_ID=MMETSP1338-20131121/5129_1 /TAXON_ID=43686 ORGANISM="Pelagodinium beii, Strain RCC1491" /NCGR_SAMPLE_ID=MMETSP1338 /ASSEMBLY_ACC=CAM_ASM_000754 /LENGTH=81 /DNA_ID=CAMNT_0043196419 /DNA_START=200 /DNA_END=443 /DNA_ORIENTATION=+